MGNISNYARVLVAKLQDVFVVDQTDNNVTTTKSVTVEQIGDTIAGTQVHSDLKTDNQTIIGGINELAKDKNIADEYDDTHTYSIGDITIYGNTLYICNTNNTTGDFDPTKWTATTIDNIIGSLSTLTTTEKGSIVGAVNEVNGKLAVETDTYNIATYGGYVKCIKYGKLITIICVDFGTTQAPSTGSAYTLATIASKYRPSVNMRVNGYANYSSYKYDGMQGYAVNSDGTIVTYNYGNPAITKGNFVLTFIKD